ncbi:MAG: HNH endonuclease [Candidatus Krumholzibacteria bacterium]|nr:HNH endonuclease [Candidatus Krumholzibacteria bacterium]
MLSLIPEFQKNFPAFEADQALKQAVGVLENAEHAVVLWFGEILRRGLFRELGYSSIYQYASIELKWSKTRTGDFMRLARKLEELPAVKESVTRGELGYTKAREIIKVATPMTEKGWVEEAKSSSRRELARKVERVRKKARTRRSGQGELLAAPCIKGLAASVPVRISLEMTPEQFARYEALWEKLHKIGSAGEKVETLLQGLALLTEQRGTSDSVSDSDGIVSVGDAPRGASIQVHVRRCPDCERAMVATSRGDLELGRAEREKMDCDAQVKEPGKRNRSVIPPAQRREVFSRDGHRCRAPGCQNTRFLEVHHIKPRAKGGTNELENLITLCSACHRLWHEHGGIPQVATRIPSVPRR